MAGDLNAKPAKPPMLDIIENYANAKLDYAKAKAEYEAAKAEYDALKALDWSTLTEEENSANKSRLLVCTFNMERAEKEMTDAETIMTTEKKAFIARYASIGANLKSVETAKANLEALLADANADGNADVIAKATEALATVTAIYNDIQTVYSDVVAKALAAELIDQEGVVIPDAVKPSTDGAVNEENKEEEKSEFDVNVTDKYVYDDGSVLAVTYGGKNGDDDAAYRTFILNYNAFKVTVKYGDTEYTVDGYGYVVINH
jgi:hypothetical protein